jgi:hypothetical protein
MIAPAFLFPRGIPGRDLPQAPNIYFFFFLAPGFGSGFSACGSKPI